jgi:hypothetical protein
MVFPVVKRHIARKLFPDNTFTQPYFTTVLTLPPKNAHQTCKLLSPQSLDWLGPHGSNHAVHDGRDLSLDVLDALSRVHHVPVHRATGLVLGLQLHELLPNFLLEVYSFVPFLAEVAALCTGQPSSEYIHSMNFVSYLGGVFNWDVEVNYTVWCR